MTTPRVPLKIAVALPEEQIPAWFDRLLPLIEKEGQARVAMILLTGRENAENSGKPFLYSLIDRLDRFFFSRRCDPLKKVPFPPGWKNIPRYRVQLPAPGGSLKLEEGMTGGVKPGGVDIILSIGIGAEFFPDQKLAKYGAWYLVFGEDRGSTAKMPGFREVMEGEGVTQTRLVCEGYGQRQTLTLARSTWFTHPFSPARHRSYYFWAAAAMLPRCLHRLHAAAMPRSLESALGATTDNLSSSKDPKKYGNLAILAAYLRLLWKRVALTGKKIFLRDRWIILEGRDRSREPDFRQFRPLSAPPRDDWADPCLIDFESREYIFFEEFEQKKHKGRIAVTAGTPDGGWLPPQTVLDRPYHLSYPFIFPWDDRFFMIPESAAVGRIDLYECVHFPTRWELHHTLIDGILARDSTIFWRDGIWWLFTALAGMPEQGANLELHLFHAKDLLTGAWSAHPMNPICSDIRRARPAGRVFTQNGRLYRPSQDCSRGYGSGIDLNEIEVLTKEDYRERPAWSLHPEWNANVKGMHTISRSPRLTVVDALVTQTVFSRFRRRDASLRI